MGKKIIVSNRLPIKIKQTASGLSYQTSEGGLATGLGSIYKEDGNLWLGWPGIVSEDEEEKASITKHLKTEQMRPVFLTEEEVKDFYEGFSNETLWPNFHYFSQYTVYDEKMWEAYQAVNQKFCSQLLELVEDDDVVWIHDYQLLLLPEYVRKHRPKISIGFFQHIPFPSYELFRLLPWRKELLMGMLGADLIGFHTYDDMRHFLSSVNRLAGIGYAQGKVELSSRNVLVDAFPMGIDYERYATVASHPETLEREVRYRTSIGDMRIILSIDRLDYSKGIPQRLKAFEMFLEKYPQYREEVSLIMVVVPSRDTVAKYQEIKEEVDELVGRINGKYSRMGWNPILYFYRSFPLTALSAFYRMAQVALVTPMRDGMNLVCKEYIASKLDKKGVLILSEMAGASKELSDAILINPNDINQLVDGLHQALQMPEEEQIKHMQVMQTSLKRYDIHNWVETFMNRLSEIKDEQRKLMTRLIDTEIESEINSQYQSAGTRLIFLDYDGTLSGFTPDPKAAGPDDELQKMMASLTSDKKNRIVIISGRDRDTLENWFASYPVDIICEHGVWLREHGKEWHLMEGVNNDWQPEILPVLKTYVDRTPGSFIEEKDYSLVWHYRKVETGLGELRTRELTSHMRYLVTNKNLQVMEGNKVIEIKNSIVDKGVAAAIWLKKYTADFIVALGDDWTDEDTFRAVNGNGITIKVGRTASEAKYCVEDVAQVRSLLKGFITGK